MWCPGPVCLVVPLTGVPCGALGQCAMLYLDSVPCGAQRLRRVLCPSRRRVTLGPEVSCDRLRPPGPFRGCGSHLATALGSCVPRTEAFIF
ncbi:hypothetical protein NDU88_000193 [Pleurodeles waltl]|uniref:Secreted protein n=1 Tax=Pleurodeles waltl TaxID=8319 RepID=A0AAV7R3I9_PLEWA|nr:hypothetical protein NDU88_000193 [Pleurodeles waltl]